MSIRNKNDIRVYNEMPFQTNLVGQHKEYVFPPCVDGTPTMNFVDWTDIEFANSRCNTFAIGMLVFDESERDEIYKELGIRNWRDTVWFDEDIVDAIENPTLEKMQKIINVTDAITLERIRGKVVYYTNIGKDISQNVVKIVNSRYKELNAGIKNSKIVVQAKDVERQASADEVEDLKRQIEEMKQLMSEQMKKTEAVNEADKVSAPVVGTPTQKRTTKKATVRK